MKRDVVESLKFILGYDITNYQDLYVHSVELGFFVSKEEAFKIKNKLEILASEFDWEKKFVVVRFNHIDDENDKIYSVYTQEGLEEDGDDYVIVEE
jgi:hypothetical protein